MKYGIALLKISPMGEIEGYDWLSIKGKPITFDSVEEANKFKYTFPIGSERDRYFNGEILEIKGF